MEHFITSVHINEVRHLKDIEIKLNPEKRQHLILTGKNGSGKTSVLQAMRCYLKAINDGMLNTIHIGWPRTVEMARRNYERATNKAEKIQAQDTIKALNLQSLNIMDSFLYNFLMKLNWIPCINRGIL